MEKGEIVIYQPTDNIRLEVRIEDETVWLNRQQIAVLFDAFSKMEMPPETIL